MLGTVLGGVSPSQVAFSLIGSGVVDGDICSWSTLLEQGYQPYTLSSSFP